jgi:hypothetical protein
VGVRRFVLLVAFGVAALGVAPSTAAAKLEFNLRSHIIYETDTSGRSPVDPERCQAVGFLEFRKIPHAKSYRVEYKYKDGRRYEVIAPPFPPDVPDPWVARFPPPKQFGRFWIGVAYSTGAGCAAALLEVEDSAKITRSKVSLDRAFQREFRQSTKRPWRSAYRPGSNHVSLKRLYGAFSDPRFIIVRRQGVITTTEKGSRQPLNLMNNRYAGPGTIVETGKNSIVKIGVLDGGSVLVAPETKIRLTRDGFDILEQTKGSQFKVHRKPGQDYKVRTSSAVLSARG